MEQQVGADKAHLHVNERVDCPNCRIGRSKNSLVILEIQKHA